MVETVIDLIRHGEPIGGRRFRGHNVDDPLTEKGWKQMWDAVSDFNAWNQIITSPLKRCHEFAHMLGERHDINVLTEPRFKEVGFGSWEGQHHDAIKVNRAEEYQAFLRDPVNQRPYGAEPLHHFVNRVNEAFEESIDRCQGQHFLIVTHAGVIRTMITKVVLAPPESLYRIKISNGGVTRIRFTPEGGVLEFLNGKL